jgi:hypothetical protein
LLVKSAKIISKKDATTRCHYQGRRCSPGFLFPRFSILWVRTLGDRIGGRVQLPRAEEIGKLRALPDSPVALIGKTGCGKSALSKQFVEASSAEATTLWFDARAFDVPNFTAFESQLHLQHSLEDLLAAFPGSSGYVVVDGLDRLFGSHVFANVATLLTKLLRQEESPWCVLLTSQPEEWGRLQQEFVQVNFRMTWTIFDVEAPKDFGALWEAFPDLEDLSRRKELRNLLLNPGVLDLLATRIDSADPDRWTGESDLIEWLWHSVIAKPPRAAVRAGFVGALGEKQGDSMRTETPLTDFPPADLPPLDELIQDRICVSREGRAAFHHERYGDWARQRVLLSRIQDLNAYLGNRISTPTWHPAIRLLGLHLLEQSGDIDRWKSVFTAAAKSGDNSPSLLQDLLLEAVIFASSPEPLLQRLWPELTANKGFWLKRLLARFLHVATLPHPMMAKVMPEAAIEASAALRVPYWPYWLPILGFLSNHRGDLLAHAPRQTAEIVICWLRQGGEAWPLRREMPAVPRNAPHGSHSGSTFKACLFRWRRLISTMRRPMNPRRMILTSG